MSRPEKVSILPQYEKSIIMYERFLDASLYNKEDIQRSEKELKIARADSTEIILDKLDYFTDNKNKANLEFEFLDRLIGSIGQSKAELFCKLISEYWYDGRSKRRESKKMLRLAKSIQNYFIEYRRVINLESIRAVDKDHVSLDEKLMFEDDEISAILEINTEMLDLHLSKWLETRNDYLEISSNDIYFRRGLLMEKKPDKDYNEFWYINSYSLALTIPEKFVTWDNKKFKIVINSSFSDLRNRILFFSPFIKDMEPYQLEIGVIPHYYDVELIYQGEYGGLEEYITKPSFRLEA